jgi:hypothetical protein
LLKLIAPGRSEFSPSKFRDETSPEDFPPMPEEYYFNADLDRETGLHREIWKAASSVNWQTIIEQRRENYLRLSEALQRLRGVTCLYERLPQGTCPLAFPILVKNRDASVRSLQQRGIDAYPWWGGFHKMDLGWREFPEACFLKKSILTLPIHQGLDAAHIDYIAGHALQVFSD